MSTCKPLHQKFALITGAAGGIGLKMVESLADAGANIIACTRTQNNEFEHHIALLEEKYKTHIEKLYFNLEHETEIKSAMHEILNKKNAIDILINNAGYITPALIGMTPINEFKKSFQVNFLSAVQITQHIAKNMIRQRSGSIINIGSIAGLDAFKGYSAYGAAKSALMQFTKIAAHEYGENSVRVNAIAPSLVETPMAKKIGEKSLNMILSKSAIQRPATTNEISDLAVFLASEKSSFINGQIIRIDGGM